jgi:hypothetical protein
MTSPPGKVRRAWFFGYDCEDISVKKVKDFVSNRFSEEQGVCGEFQLLHENQRFSRVALEGVLPHASPPPNLLF